MLRIRTPSSTLRPRRQPLCLLHVLAVKLLLTRCMLESSFSVHLSLRLRLVESTVVALQGRDRPRALTTDLNQAPSSARSARAT